MGVETFYAREGEDVGEGGSSGGGGHAHDGGAALELVRPNAGEGLTGATGGEGVAGAGKEVSTGNGGVGARINGTGGADAGQGGLLYGGVYHQHQVLGGVGVHNVCPLLYRGYQEAVCVVL